MNSDTLDIAGRRCHLYRQDAAQCLLVQPLGGHEQEVLANEVASIAAGTSMPFALAAFDIQDWEQELTPWGDTANGAKATLTFILAEMLPELELRFGKLPVVLGGYSLAGLFALWAGCEKDAFTGVAAASPSLWVPDWPVYALHHPVQTRQVYLSLGIREEQTRNQLFSQVGNRVREEYALLQRQLGEENCILVWNQGGHFRDCERRLANAFIWNLTRLQEAKRMTALTSSPTTD